MAEQKQEILEEAIDILEDQVEVVEKSMSLVARIIWNHKTHVGVAFAVGAGIGSAVTYKVTKEKLSKKFELIMDTEIERAKEHYSRKEKTGDYADPVSAAKKILGEDHVVGKEGFEAFQSYQPGEPSNESPESVEEAEELIREEVKRSKKKNIFENSPTEFRWDEEMVKRENLADTEPYIITFGEFNEDDEFDTKQLTYYQKDDVLTDEADEVVHDVDNTVGDDNLIFGYGSNDGNTVYVRNPRIELNMEIVRSEGSYAAEVLGFGDDDEAELKHSTHRPGRRFRSSDE